MFRYIIFVILLFFCAEFAHSFNNIVNCLQDSIIIDNEDMTNNKLMKFNTNIELKNKKGKKEKQNHRKKQSNTLKKDREIDIDFELQPTDWNRQKEIIINSIFGQSSETSNADSIIRALDKLPSFGIYKDNYIVAGTELFTKPNQWNSDAKFQVSIRQRLTNSVLPFRTFLFFSYTQKAFWDIFQDSFPFREIDFNPAVGIGRPLIYKNRFLGYTSLMLEHESNGKDGEDSRSWNKITMASAFLLHERWTMEADLSIPLVDGEGNKDIVKYTGWARFKMEYTSTNRRCIVGGEFLKRGGWNLNTNFTLSFAYKFFKNSNQYFFLEYYNGYGENMLDYKVYRQRLRAGFVFKPKFLNFY